MEKISVTRRIPADIAVVVFGTDRAKKQHASRFGADTAKSAQAAARSMGMRAIRVVTPEQRDIALRLPKGTVSAAGRAQVPLVKPALYRQLLAVAGPDATSPGTPPAAPSGQPTGPAKPPAAPFSPIAPKPAPAPAEGAKAGEGKSDPSGGGTIGLAKGAVVLATDDPAGGWWPATVQFVDGELLTLRWQAAEWKDLPTIIRKLSQVAVMPKGKPC